ncbi:MAG TPA: lytic transglycosylase, partial [Bradyrhizobium sp.]|nr:lytic transglycosylase [Bradyrhizobium sp.]
MNHKFWKPDTGLYRERDFAIAIGVIVLALSFVPFAAIAARKAHVWLDPRGEHFRAPAPRALPYPRLVWPIEIDGGQYRPVAWDEIAGWAADDHLQAYKAFRSSCASIAGQRNPTADVKALGTSLRAPCRAAKALDITDRAKARAFFEENFLPLEIARLGEEAGFVTGYYEPVIE